MTGRALIFGVTGQDGSYLAELLLSKGYEVTGTMRRSSSPNLGRLVVCVDQLQLRWCDITDESSVMATIRETEPDEVYNLAAMSDVGISFEIPSYSAGVTGAGAVHILEALRQIRPDARFYQAGSSEMFGLNPNVPTNEASAFHPASPYASAKVFAHHSTVNYREAFGLHASAGILFNHESPRRGENFVTRKITRAVARIRAGEQHDLVLGRLDTRRDWGHARDYVRAMWLMLQQKTPSDYVVATGQAFSVKDFVAEAFELAELNWSEHVLIDATTARPLDPPVLIGDATKAQDRLGWKPETSFRELVAEMVDADMRRFGA